MSSTMEWRPWPRPLPCSLACAALVSIARLGSGSGVRLHLRRLADVASSSLVGPAGCLGPLRSGGVTPTRQVTSQGDGTPLCGSRAGRSERVALGAAHLASHVRAGS
jgi:hypothetical protein